MTLKQCREKAKMSIEDMAMHLGITSKTYKYYEEHSNLMPVHIALLFSKIVNVKYDNIIFLP